MAISCFVVFKSSFIVVVLKIVLSFGRPPNVFSGNGSKGTILVDESTTTFCANICWESVFVSSKDDHEHLTLLA